MDFTEAKSHAMGVLFDTDLFPKLVTYTPSGGDPIPDVPAAVVFGTDDTNAGRKGDGHTWRLTVSKNVRADFRSGSTRDVATVTVRTMDIPSPGYRDKLAFDGIEYRVVEIFDHA